MHAFVTSVLAQASSVLIHSLSQGQVKLIPPASCTFAHSTFHALWLWAIKVTVTLSCNAKVKQSSSWSCPAYVAVSPSFAGWSVVWQQAPEEEPSQILINRLWSVSAHFSELVLISNWDIRLPERYWYSYPISFYYKWHSNLFKFGSSKPCLCPFNFGEPLPTRIRKINVKL